MRSLARSLAHRVRATIAWTDRRRIAWAGLPAGGHVQVSYGYRHLSRPSDVEVGGIVKLQGLQREFPNSPRRFNVLYLVSSRLPEAPVALGRATKRKGARIVVNQNGVAYAGWYGPGWEQVNAPMAELLGLADHVFYQSEFCRLCADRFLGQPAGRSEVLHNAVDTTRFAPAPQERRPLTLLIGGTQQQWYRVDVALQVLARVSRDVPEARLLVAGRLRWKAAGRSGQLKEARARAREFGVDDRVTFLGPYSQADAPAIFHRGDLLLHPKYNDPCPTTVIEAMAAGLPIVYSKSGGVPELVGGEAGIGVPSELDFERDHPPSPDALAEAVLAVAGARERFAAAARERAVERFDVRRWVARHAEVFQGLVA